MHRPLRLAILFGGLTLGLPFASGQPAKEAPEPAEVSYYRHVRPIFQQHCQGCHQPARAQGGYVMTDYAELLKPGESGKPSVAPGKPEESFLLAQVVGQAGKPPAMPKGKDPLPERDVKLISRWIAAGAKDDTPASARGVAVDMDHPPVYRLPPVVTSLDFSPDGRLLAVAGYHEVVLHQADGSGLVARLVGLSERVQSLAFSPDGKSLAVTGGSPGRFGEVQIWDVEKRKLRLAVTVTYDTTYGASWSPDGTKVAFGCGDNTLRAIDAATGKQVLFQGAHNDWVLDTVFSTDASHLVSVSRDMSMKLTEVATQRFVDNITSITPGALKGGLQAVDRHPFKDELLIGGADGVPKVYQMYRHKKRVIGDDFNHIRSLEPVPGRIFDVKYDRTGTLVAVGSSLDGKGEVRVYRSAVKADAVRNGLGGFLAAPSCGLSTLLSYPDPLCDGRPVCKADGQHGAVYAVAFRPDSRVVASAGFDGKVRLNDAATGKLLREFVPVPLTPEATSVTSKSASGNTGGK